jgi:hypothetical protein
LLARGTVETNVVAQFGEFEEDGTVEYEGFTDLDNQETVRLPDGELKLCCDNWHTWGAVDLDDPTPSAVEPSDAEYAVRKVQVDLAYAMKQLEVAKSATTQVMVYDAVCRLEDALGRIDEHVNPKQQETVGFMCEDGGEG